MLYSIYIIFAELSELQNVRLNLEMFSQSNKVIFYIATYNYLCIWDIWCIYDICMHYINMTCVGNVSYIGRLSYTFWAHREAASGCGIGLYHFRTKQVSWRLLVQGWAGPPNLVTGKLREEQNRSRQKHCALESR